MNSGKFRVLKFVTMYKQIYVRVMQFLRINFQSINLYQLIDSLLPLILAQL